MWVTPIRLCFAENDTVISDRVSGRVKKKRSKAMPVTGREGP
jgi:hypothetical protein